jgi:hypothetical protein
MFLSKDDLKLAYGVDLEIGARYIDRSIPEGNLYWQQRKIYIPESPGYYFMPIFSDILFRLGLSKDFLLSETIFKVAEEILHSAALLEYKKIGWPEHIRQLKEAICPHVTNDVFYRKLLEYLDVPDRPSSNGLFGTKFPSLNRADSYLLLLACLPSEGFNLDSAIKAWYALMTYFLILDDLVDIKDDLKNKEENAFIEAGFHPLGLKTIEEMISDSHDILLGINPVLANRIDHKRKTMDLTELIRSILSE